MRNIFCKGKLIQRRKQEKRRVPRSEKKKEMGMGERPRRHSHRGGQSRGGGWKKRKGRNGINEQGATTTGRIRNNMKKAKNSFDREN